MDYLTFFAEIIGDMSWPLSMLIIVWWFRSPISELIKRIRSFETDGKKYKLEIESAAKKVPDLIHTKIPQEVQDLATKYPVKAIEESWENLHASAINAADVTLESNIFEIADTLVNKKLFTLNEASAFHDLSNLKDEALSGKEIITDASSSSYASVAYTLSDKVKDK